jgi:alkanesulfonate monooxygenase SsuD/methylene tetrahydromethanopterin reductase-like flavin-dependent oxidoreductase (luciferase family)
MAMKVGFILPGGSASAQVRQAVLAEETGWDGVFVWEAAYGVDAWSLLAAMAVRTERVQLGTLLTPLPWRRPWKVASQVATLDELSGGRAILTVGLGAIMTDLPLTGEALERRTRADMMDEGIDLIRDLWAGRQEFHGRHYDYICERPDLVAALRQPRETIPIWVVGAWPRPRSMRRVLRCDGIVPQYDGDDWGPDRLRDIRDWLGAHANHQIDVISEGETAADNTAAAAATVRPWADAGATWWLETRWEMPHHSAERMQQVHDRIAAGPPTLD